MSVPPQSARPRRRSLRRMAAWVAAAATDPAPSRHFVAGVILLHVILWSRVLTLLKEGQDVHFDVAEAFAWGQQFLLGYGKHPPLSGWVAGLWFRLFPAADWSAYALAMAVGGLGMWFCWLIALKVVDRRRAFLVVLMLAIYPIFNFKGFKYNADLIQLATLPLLALAYLHAFERRSVMSGVWLGLAGAAALLGKYWALTMIGAVGIAALLHPQRLLFLRSPAPWVAIAVLLAAMAPHLVWLWRSDFLPLTYAGGIYEISSRADSLRGAIGYLTHNLVLLALPVVLAALALLHAPWRSSTARWSLPAIVARNWSRGPNPTVRVSRAIHVWIIQIVLAFGPPLGAVAFVIAMKTDWGIPLFVLTPLALLAIPMLRVPRVALFRLVAVWLLATLAVLAAAPQIVRLTLKHNVPGVDAYDARSELARDLTQQWRLRFNTPWAAVVGSTRVADVMTFYSIDHPLPLTPGEPPSGLLTLAEAQRTGFVGICNPAAADYQGCKAWMTAHAASADLVVMSTRRFVQGIAGPVVNWEVHFMPPARDLAPPRR